MLDRRQCLMALAACAIAPVARAKDAAPLYAAARRDAAGGFSLALFAPDGEERAAIPLPDRGHDIALRPGSREIVAFARRPGRFGMALSASGHLIAAFEAAPGHHFYGHGVFSADGRLLYSTEFDIDGQRGVIGIRDATKAYRQIGAFPAHGVEPHDILLMPDGRTLVIADGGILTEPREGGRELNLDRMQPSLSYIDVRSGDLIERQTLPAALHQLSIRHLALAMTDTVVFACQHRGTGDEHPRLVGLHRRGEVPILLDMPDDTLGAMRNYVGSVTTDNSGSIIAASSPRGGLVAFFDASNRRFLGTIGLADGCGIAPARHRGAFLMTSGEGVIATGGPSGIEQSARTRFAWDNHAVLIA